MQKAVIVRNALDDEIGRSWSYEVDIPAQKVANPLRDLLADGWRVVQTCPMPNELDSCCLVIVEKSADPRPVGQVRDLPLHELGYQTEQGGHGRRPMPQRVWRGESMLRIFGIEPA